MLDQMKIDENSLYSTFTTIKRRLSEHSGIWYILAANIIFACCTFVLKLIPADMFDIMIVRFFIQSVVFGSYASLYKHYNIFDSNGQPVACALNILMSSGTNLTYLAAFYFLPLSDLNAIKYTYIVWAAILSVIFLKEPFKYTNGVSLVLTLLGLTLATNPQFLLNPLTRTFASASLNLTTTIATTIATDPSVGTSSISYYIGIIFAFLSSLTKAIQMIARKQLVKMKQPYSVMNFQFTVFALIVALTYSIIRRQWYPEPYPWKWMCTVGVAIGFCQLLTNTFYAKALKRENVQLLSILGTLDILYACLLQYIFLKIVKSWIFYLGASCIVASAVLLSVDNYLRNRK